VIDHADAAGAWHQLRHDVRITGNVFAEVPRHHARADVDAAAGGAGDQDGDLLALVEVLGGGRRGQRCDRDRESGYAKEGLHHVILQAICACA
jgi:hypothetical protein